MSQVHENMLNDLGLKQFLDTVGVDGAMCLAVYAPRMFKKGNKKYEKTIRLLKKDFPGLHRFIIEREAYLIRSSDSKLRAVTKRDNADGTRRKSGRPSKGSFQRRFVADES